MLVSFKFTFVHKKPPYETMLSVIIAIKIYRNSRAPIGCHPAIDTVKI